MSPPIESAERTAGSRGPEPARPVAPLLASFQAVRKMTESLAQPLSPEDCQIQSMPDASPVKWHLAHTTWFFETFVLAPHAQRILGVSSVLHVSFQFLLQCRWRAAASAPARTDHAAHARRGLRLSRGHRSRDRGLSRVGRGSTSGGRRGRDRAGLNHEQQHQELILTDIKHALAQNPLRPAYRDGVGQTVATRRCGRWTGRLLTGA